MTLGTTATADDAGAATLGLMSPAPRLPRRGRAARRAGALSTLTHGAAAAALVLAAAWPRPNPAVSEPAGPHPSAPAPRLVFLQMPGPPSRGGGGGGARDQLPPSPALPRPLLGAEAVRVQPVAPDLPVLETVPLASGMTFVIGLPDAQASGTLSRGPGVGGGVGTGTGTGIGEGTGPGLGPGSGGGFGGGAYRPGGSVKPPTLLRRMLPKYTPEALQRRIQGTVVLEVVVGRDGVPTTIRVMRSLDPGLDAEAVAAVRQWHFAPGRLGDTPVDVLVSIWIDFHVV